MTFPKYEMNRKNFALTFFSAWPIATAIIWPTSLIDNHELLVAAMILSGVITLGIMATSILLRLSNIGKSKLWFIGLFVPLLNLYIFPMVWSYPPNVKENGMDKKAYFIFILILLIVSANVLLQTIEA